MGNLNTLVEQRVLEHKETSGKPRSAEKRFQSVRIKARQAVNGLKKTFDQLTLRDRSDEEEMDTILAEFEQLDKETQMFLGLGQVDGLNDRLPEGIRKHSTEIKTTGGKVELVSYTPEDSTDVPVIFAPGWGNTEEVLKEPMIMLADRSKRKTVTVSHPRRGGKIEQHSDFAGEELRKALSLIAACEAEGGGPVDIIAHSEGAINATIAATLRPDLFRSLILVAPGGMVGKDSMWTLFHRSGEDTRLTKQRRIEEPELAEKFDLFKKTSDSYVRQNPLRALLEAQSIANTEIHLLLRALHDQGKKIAIIHGVNDAMFPMDKMQQIAKIDQLDGFISTYGGHEEFKLHPDKYIPIFMRLFDAFARQRVKKGVAQFFQESTKEKEEKAA